MTIDEVLEERGDIYGDYQMVAAKSQEIKKIIKRSHNWDDLEEYQKESLDMICNKLARILNGDPNYIDSWVDIAGYAQLVVNELVKKETKK